MKSKAIEVRLWGSTVGYIGYASDTRFATFEYSDAILNSSFELSPIVMPNRQQRHIFEDISFRTFKGVPGVFADSLPDTFGNQLIDIYMAARNIPANLITTLDRLLYVGGRGMGALEYHPAESFGARAEASVALDLNSLSELAAMVASKQADKQAAILSSDNLEQAIKLIRVGSSAGGARAKALVAKSPDGQFFDGTLDHGIDHTYWLMKFDTDQNEDRDGKDPKGMTRIEYIYGLIAKNAGINMPRINHLTIGDDFHFMIERFDRIVREGKLDKLHYASWSGLAHAHRDETGAYAYEQLVLMMRQMNLPQADVTELFRRAVFNVVGRNQDDHTKNFGFVADRAGEWRLSPAFDMTYSYDPLGKWTSQHQIRLNMKQDGFTRDDLLNFAKHCNLTKRQGAAIINDVLGAFADFPKLAKEYGVPPELSKTVEQFQRIDAFRPQVSAKLANDLNLILKM
jgi:serine/threonine-protein kinase HipA